MNRDATDQAGAAARPRLAWHRPELVTYGSISKLTQSGGSTKKESGVPRMKMCL
ncbi:MAG: hypothetical protein AB7V01_00575 [Vicinamibacterales bacterium]